MAANSLAEIVDQCVEDLHAGRTTLAECLARHPNLTDELAPLLRIAQSIGPFEVTPDPARKLAARARFIEALYSEPGTPRLARWFHRLLPAPGLLRLSAPGIASIAIAAALVTGSGAVYASEQAQPGAPLYGVKLAFEQVRVAAARDEEDKLQVQLEIAGRRLEEVERALQTGDDGAVGIAAEHYAHTLEEAQSRIRALPPASEARALERVETSLDRHEKVLSRVTQEASPKAKESIERAREGAQKELQLAVGASGQARTPGGRTPPTVPSPSALSSVVATPGIPDASLAPTAVFPTTLVSPTPDPIAQVAALQAQVDQLDGALPGRSDEGLGAKLDAVEAALRRGQPGVAANQLDAFLDQLDALHRQGRVTEAAYQRLSQAASSLEQLIDEQGRSRRRDPAPTTRGRDDDSRPPPTRTPAAVATGTSTLRGRDDDPDDRTGRRATAEPTRTLAPRTATLPGRGGNEDDDDRRTREPTRQERTGQPTATRSVATATPTPAARATSTSTPRPNRGGQSGNNQGSGERDNSPGRGSSDRDRSDTQSSPVPATGPQGRPRGSDTGDSRSERDSPKSVPASNGRGSLRSDG